MRRGECAALIRAWDEPDRFEHDVAYDDEREGRFACRFFARPLPPLVAELRTEVYARLAGFADRLARETKRRDRFPLHLDEFLAKCDDAGQRRTSPALLRFPEGGFRAPHREVARVLFPFELFVVLGPDAPDAPDTPDAARATHRSASSSSSPTGGTQSTSPRPPPSISRPNHSWTARGDRR